MILDHRAQLAAQGSGAYILGITGSVSSGKTTIAGLLAETLCSIGTPLRVEVVATDGFLLPKAVLEARGMMERKGFPESYDLPRLLTFLDAVRGGLSTLDVPQYCHRTYDVLDDQRVIETPDLLILEGINVLQASVPDRLDLAIYIDAEVSTIEGWYVERFLGLLDAVEEDPESYFRRFTHLTRAEAVELAHTVWRTINLPNLEQHIAPSREHADVVLYKNSDHSISSIVLVSDAFERLGQDLGRFRAPSDRS